MQISKTLAPEQRQHAKAIQACKQSFCYVALFSFFVNLLMLTVPIYMLQLFDRVLASRSYDTLIYLTLIAIIALGVFALMDVARSRIVIAVSSWLDNFLSPVALSRSADEILQGRHYGSQSLRDILNIRQFLGGPGVFAILDSPWVPLYLFVIFLLHPLLGTIATVGAILLFCLALVNELVTHEALTEAGARAVKTQGQTDSALRNAEVIQAMGMMPNIVKRWHHENEKVLALQTLASQRAGLLLSISKFLRFTLQLLMLGTGAYLAVSNQITPGVMIAGSILLSRALAPVEQVIGVWKQMTSARQAYHRLAKHFSEEVNRSAGIQLPKPVGHLEFKNVYYVPPRQEKPILNNVSFNIPAGQMTAIIGPSAAGKSTLARLMVGAWSPTAGAARLDGATIYTWDRDHFGKHVGYLPQAVELFSGTVKENIARLGEASDDAVIQAAQQAGVHDMILKLPQGYDTPIGPGDYSLSGGQRQRIALARALYGNPQVIILDEPNSNLDSDGEIALLNALEHAKSRGATVILIAHRPSMIRTVDRVIVLHGGQVQLMGPRDEVLAKVSQLQQQAPEAHVTRTQGESHEQANQ